MPRGSFRKCPVHWVRRVVSPQSGKFKTISRGFKWSYFFVINGRIRAGAMAEAGQEQGWSRSRAGTRQEQGRSRSLIVTPIRNLIQTKLKDFAIGRFGLVGLAGQKIAVAISNSFYVF